MRGGGENAAINVAFRKGLRCSGNDPHKLALPGCNPEDSSMNAIIYLVGLVVVVMFILSLVGIR
jgi:hypothetical protein